MDSAVLQTIGTHTAVAGTSIFAVWKWFVKEKRSKNKEEVEWNMKRETAIFEMQQRILTYANEEVAKERKLRNECEIGKREDAQMYDKSIRELRKEYEVLSKEHSALKLKVNRLENELNDLKSK